MMGCMTVMQPITGTLRHGTSVMLDAWMHLMQQTHQDVGCMLQVVYGCGNDRFGGCGSILSIHQTGSGGCGGYVHAAQCTLLTLLLRLADGGIEFAKEWCPDFTLDFTP